MNLVAFVAQAPLPVLVTGGALAVLVLGFLGVFLVPGVLHWRRLRRMQQRIARFDAKNLAITEFKKVFATDKRLAHLWREYQESLHLQREERNGQLVVVAARSTTPAEMSSCR